MRAVQPWEREDFGKAAEESFEEIFVVYFHLDIARQLREQIKILLLLESVVFVVLPFVFEKSFDSLLERNVDGLHVVELLDGAKELRQVVAIVEAGVERVERNQYL